MSPEYKEYVIHIPTKSTESFESLMNHMPDWKIVADRDSAALASKGGKARAAALSPERRREIARLGGIARQQKARKVPE